jgi:predicted RNA-binding protein with RPS1 domain
VDYVPNIEPILVEVKAALDDQVKIIKIDVEKYEDLAIKAYEKGKMAQGKKYEAKSDKLYKDNYNKMFGRR